MWNYLFKTCFVLALELNNDIFPHKNLLDWKARKQYGELVDIVILITEDLINALLLEGLFSVLR